MIRELRVDNIGHFEELTVRAGALTVLSGTNGAGKSTLIQALLVIFEGGHAPHLIRAGCPKGRIQITLQNGVVIEETITVKGYTLKVTAEDGQEVKAPSAYVKKLANGFALDPVAFIDAGKKGASGQKERQKFLQAILPSTYVSAEVEKAIGDAVGVLPHFVPGSNYDQDGFDGIFKHLYDSRTRANGDLDNANSTVTTLSRNLPAEAEGAPDCKSEVTRLRTEKKALDDEKIGEIKNIETQLQNDLTQIRSKYEELCEAARKQAADSRKELDATADPIIQEKVSELTRAEENLQSAARIEQTKADIDTIRAKAKEAGARAMKLGRAVKAMEALKKQKLSQMPVDGLELREGRVFVDGLDFDTQLNTARQYATALQICAIGAGDLGLMVCDRGESLEAETSWKEFEQAVLNSGMQVFAAKVASGPLAVSARSH